MTFKSSSPRIVSGYFYSMTPIQAAYGLIYGYEKIGVKESLVIKCALYACERIHGQYAQINKDGSENEDWKFWLEAYNYLKTKQ